MGRNCLAVDIGASSGRVIMSTLTDNKINLKEIHRFKNQMYKEKGSFYWDIDKLFGEIVKGLKIFSNNDLEADSIGIDTWAVDYVLLGKDGKRISPVYAYRDNRTNNSIDDFTEKISKEDIYSKTGIQFIQFNTLYQLYEHVKSNPSIIENISSILMIPDYLNYLLCNEKAVEYTNATTTQFYNIHDKTWDDELVKEIGLTSSVFPSIAKAGTVIGSLNDKLESETNIKGLKVIAPATHDTGSAVVAVPAIDYEFAYISSGTWSLMGIESDIPICSQEALNYNFTNEGGAYDTIRFLKNIMGLWLIQEVKRILNDKYSFAKLVELAKEAESISIINPNDNRFLNPENMVNEIKNYCKETNQIVPNTVGEIAKCIFESLALQYKQVLLQLRKISNKTINKIHIVGGGCQNDYLNQLCADYTECEVFAGPIEATAIGNIMVQYITLGEIDNISEARKIIMDSFEIRRFKPDFDVNIDDKWNKFKELI
ncbi:rhamnulokinase [Vallitalea longa]|uniref:Rhamnulokinase n=1 Tax=Vallitalea longa TaxID=2936439 RepID=A0A9W5Y7F6_9FIRM|nr:rhamnulokinase [Vallitalea longa]GKX28147.1 rhamnulokinase [Vallitalea longa]